MRPIRCSSRARFHLGALRPEIGQRRPDDAPEDALLERLVPFASAVLVDVLVGGAGLEGVGRVAQTPLPALQLVRAARLHQLERLVQAVDPALERPQQREGRAGLPALKDAHREPGGGPVQHAGLVVRRGDVAGRRFVQRLLRRTQRVAERVAAPLRIERAAVEPDHLLLRAADEQPPALLLGKRPEGVYRGQHVGRQQAPEAVPGKVLPHVRGRGQQQEMGRRPAERPARTVGRHARQRFGETVAVRLADRQVRLLVGGQLVRLVEHDQVVGRSRSRRRRLAQPAERPLARQGVDADDHPVAPRSGERVAGARVRAAHDPETEREQRPQLAFPVADQPGRRDDQHAGDEPARQHLAQVQAGHDRLARPGVVGEQEPEGGKAEHPLVDGDPLVRQRIDPRHFGGERRIGEVTAGEPGRLRDRRDDVGIGREIGPPGGTDARRAVSRNRAVGTHLAANSS